MLKIQEVILRAVDGRILWSQAAEIIGISDRSMRRWRQRYEEYGYDGLYDRRLKRPSPKKVPLATVERVLRLYREKYFDFNVRHFVEKLHGEHGIDLSYTWVKTALRTDGLVVRSRKPEKAPAAAPAGDDAARRREHACVARGESTAGSGSDSGRCDFGGLTTATATARRCIARSPSSPTGRRARYDLVRV